MKRLLAGVTIAFLAAAVLALMHRVERLHDEMARLRARAPRTMTRVIEREVPVPAAAPELPAPKRAEEPPAPWAGMELLDPTGEESISSVQPEPPIRASMSNSSGIVSPVVFTLSTAGWDLDALGLTDYQKTRLAEHEQARELMRKAADEEYDRLLRSELTPEQLQKHDELMKSQSAVYYSAKVALKAITQVQEAVQPPSEP